MQKSDKSYHLGRGGSFFYFTSLFVSLNEVAEQKWRRCCYIKTKNPNFLKIFGNRFNYNDFYSIMLER